MNNKIYSTHTPERGSGLFKNRFVHTSINKVTGNLEPISSTINSSIKNWTNKHNINQNLICIDIVSAYFSPAGWYEIKDSISKVEGRIRLLIGGEQDAYTEYDQSVPSKIEITESIKAHRKDIITANLYKIVLFLNWLKKPNSNVEIRLYKDAFLHAKTWHFYEKDNRNNAGSLITGSANFTKSGMGKNIEAMILLDNVTDSDNEEIQKAKKWFDETWEQSIDYKDALINIYQELIDNYSPELIWVKMLDTLSTNTDLERDLTILEYDSSDWLLNLPEFQKDAAKQVQVRLNKYRGCILADEVGLGKTYVAGANIRLALANHSTVLIVSPPSLTEMWHNFLEHPDNQIFNYGLSWKTQNKSYKVEHTTYNELQKKLNGSELTFDDKREKFGGYDFIVFDEAHTIRKNTTKTYSAIENELKLLNPNASILLLTATPINNSVRDIYSLLNLFLADAELGEETGIYSLKSQFAMAHKITENAKKTQKDIRIADWGWLHGVLNRVLVKRTREYVIKEYGLENNSDYKFPKIISNHVRYVLNKEYKDVADDIIKSLSPNMNSLGRFNMAAYSWQQFSESREHAGIAPELLRTTLLKSISSSKEALIQILRKIKETTENRLNEVSEEGIIRTESYESTEDEIDKIEDELEDVLEEDSIESVAAEGTHKIKVENIEEYKKLLQEDSDSLSLWLSLLEDLNGDGTTKIDKLVNLINDLSNKTGDARKIILFTTSKVTANELYNQLQTAKDLNQIYKNNVRLVTGSIPKQKRVQLLHSFSPTTIDKPKPYDSSLEESCLLITTDVLAEGVNLQSAANVIHFDLPWNPMKVIQRLGRINRLKSNHSIINNYLMVPAEGEEWFNTTLKLLFVLEHKMHLAKAIVGEKNVISDIDGDEVSFENIDELHEQIISLIQELEDRYSQEEIYSAIDKFLKEKSNRSISGQGELIYSNYKKDKKFYDFLLGKSDIDLNGSDNLLQIQDLLSIKEEYLRINKKLNKLNKLPLRTGSIVANHKHELGWLICFKIKDKNIYNDKELVVINWIPDIILENRPTQLRVLSSFEALTKLNPFDENINCIFSPSSESLSQSINEHLEVAFRYAINLWSDTHNDFNIKVILPEFEDILLIWESEMNNHPEMQSLSDSFKKLKRIQQNQHKLTESQITFLKKYFKKSKTDENSYQEIIKIVLEQTQSWMIKTSSNDKINDPEFELLFWMRFNGK